MAKAARSWVVARAGNYRILREDNAAYFVQERRRAWWTLGLRVLWVDINNGHEREPQLFHSLDEATRWASERTRKWANKTST